MPRNSSGVYTLPSGNPVVPGTTIDAAWANDTLEDLANEVTNSLSRTGAGGMLAPFRLFDGTVTAPGIAWLNETNSGLYRSGAGSTWMSILGVNVAQFSTVGLTIPFGKALTAQGNASVSGTLAVTGATTLSSTLAVTGAITATGGVVGNVTGNVTAASGTSTFNDVTINGSLDMVAGSSATITGLSNPVNASDAANKGYVDTQDALKLSLTGGTMSGNIAMGGNLVTGLGSPVAGGDATNKTYVDAQVATRLPLAGGTMTGYINMNGYDIVGLSAPTDPAMAANKAYVDSMAQGIDAKASCKIATETNTTLSGGQIIQGVALVTGDRVLVKSQTSAAENGIYTVASGVWPRAADANTWDELVAAYTFIEQGTNANNGYVCTVTAGGTLGTTPVTWVQFSGAGQIDAGAGLTKTGNQLNVGTASSSRIVVNTDNIDLATTGVTGGTYKSVTVDTYGRVTGGTNPTTLAGYGITDAYTTTQVDAALALKLNLSGGTMSGAIAMGNNKITGLGAPTNTTDATTKTYVDTADALKLNLTGGTMSGAIAMGANKITGMADPTNPQDAATKNYIDTIFGSTTSAAASATAAANSASAAATSATNAATSASNAATSATNAATSYTTFNNQYLGSKTSDPTVNNTGGALVAGNLYWNSTVPEMRVYNGSAWVAAYLPATNYTFSGNVTLSAGTANGVAYLNGSKVITTGSALTFDGTNFSTTGTASATKFIPTGGSATGNGMYLPASNTLAWSTNGTERVRLDSSGNLGLGVTPQTWGSQYKAFEVAGASAGVVAAYVNALNLGTAFRNDNTNWLYTFTGQIPLRYEMSASGQFRWFNAASGTAGNTISFTQAMTLNASGDLLVGATAANLTASGRGLIVANGSASSILSLENGGATAFYLFANGDNADVWNSRNGFLRFGTNSAERMRLDSSGNLGIGTSSPALKLSILSNNSTSNNSIPLVLLGSDRTDRYASIDCVRGSASSFIGLAFSTSNNAAPSEVMRLDPSGNLLLGATTQAFQEKFQMYGNYALFKDASYTGFIGSGTALGTSTASDFAIRSSNAIAFLSGGATERLRLDSAGNLGLGVTPSAWYSAYKAIDFGTFGAIATSGPGTTILSANYYVNASNALAYKGNGYAGGYNIRTDNGEHRWFIGANNVSGAGAALTLTQAMTLDASGNLVVGSTTAKARAQISAASAQNSPTLGTAQGILYLSNNDPAYGLCIGNSSTTGVAWFQAQRTDGTATAYDLNFCPAGGNALVTGPGGLGYGTGSGGAVTQATSRTTGVTLDKTNGAITLVSAAGTTTWQTFTVTNSKVAATDTIIVNQKSGTDLYQIFVTNVAAGSFKISFATTGGTTTEQPVFNFAVIKAVAA